MKRQDLTPRESAILRFIQREMRRTGGVSPTVREIVASGIMRSFGHCNKLLKGLERRGHLRRLIFRHRAMVVIRPIPEGAAYRFDDETKSLVKFREIAVMD